VAQRTIHTRQLSAAELCRLGEEIYERQLKRTLELVHDGEHVVIHVANGDYAVDADEYRAFSALSEKYPDDVFFFARVESDAGEELRSPLLT
jgi:tRNA threonylcarbamoyladenosine modification (KEOPS) complex Cgi121 subunit